MLYRMFFVTWSIDDLRECDAQEILEIQRRGSSAAAKKLD